MVGPADKLGASWPLDHLGYGGGGGGGSGGGGLGTPPDFSEERFCIVDPHGPLSFGRRHRASCRAYRHYAATCSIKVFIVARRALRGISQQLNVFCGSMVTRQTYKTRRYRTSCSRLRRCLWAA